MSASTVYVPGNLGVKEIGEQARTTSLASWVARIAIIWPQRGHTGTTFLVVLAKETQLKFKTHINSNGTIVVIKPSMILAKYFFTPVASVRKKIKTFTLAHTTVLA